MAEKLSKMNLSVEKTLEIIEVMAANPPLRLQEIAERTGMPASTVLRMVNTLVVHGYALQNSQTLHYSLSMRFARIGNQICSRVSILDICHPKLVELSEQCQESCCLAIEENMEAVYTDVVEGPDSMLKIMQRIGKRAPMHCTGVGKLLLLEYSPEMLADYERKEGLTSFTPNTITTLEALERELARVRAQGYAMDNEECELGARCVAAPIRNYTGKITAAISASGPISRMTGVRIAQITEELMRTADEISELLAYKK